MPKTFVCHLLRRRFLLIAFQYKQCWTIDQVFRVGVATPTVQGISNSRTTILPQNCNQILKPEME